MKTLHIKLTLNYDDTQHTDDAMCQSVQDILQAHEHTVLQCEVVEHCPKCDSDEVEICHHAATFAVPECNYRHCTNCKEEVAFWSDHIHSLPNQSTSYSCFSSQQWHDMAREQNELLKQVSQVIYGPPIEKTLDRFNAMEKGTK